MKSINYCNYNITNLNTLAGRNTMYNNNNNQFDHMNNFLSRNNNNNHKYNITSEE